MSSSRCSTPNPGQAITVTANCNFKVEVHAPASGSGGPSTTVSCANEAPTRPVSSRSRRSAASNRDSLSGSSSVHSSLSDSLRSSLSSNDGDAGFSEK